jgi:hypothetical protein
MHTTHGQPPWGAGHKLTSIAQFMAAAADHDMIV